MCPNQAIDELATLFPNRIGSTIKKCSFVLEMEVSTVEF